MSTLGQRLAVVELDDITREVAALGWTVALRARFAAVRVRADRLAVAQVSAGRSTLGARVAARRNAA